MPELPEVESTRRKLDELLLGDELLSVKVHWPRMWERRGPSLAPRFSRPMRVDSTARRGKYLLLSLCSETDSRDLIIHLRMSGRMDVEEGSKKRSKYHHVCFKLASGRELRFRDPRKFGRVICTRDKEHFLAHLGPEPFDKTLNGERFHDMLSRRKSALKTLLLNQTFLAGLGNIYVDEVLWKSRLHPLRAASSLSSAEAKTLLRNIRSILKRAIKNHGTDFGDKVIEKGNYQPAIYGRAGEPCLVCGREIQRLVVSQRGTSICPNCQSR